MEWYSKAIGTLNGSTVYGHYFRLGDDAPGKPSHVSVMWREEGPVDVLLDKHGAPLVSLPFDTDYATMAEVGNLAELLTTDLIVRLIPMARAWAASPALDLNVPIAEWLQKRVLEETLAAAERNSGHRLWSITSMELLEWSTLAAGCDDLHILAGYRRALAEASAEDRATAARVLAEIADRDRDWADGGVDTYRDMLAKAEQRARERTERQDHLLRLASELDRLAAEQGLVVGTRAA